MNGCRGKHILQKRLFRLLTIAIASVVWSQVAIAGQAPVSFSREVAPVLIKQCQSCHGPDKAKSKYRLDTFARLEMPGKSKAVPITGGAPDKSELFRLISTSDEDDRMPQKADALPAAQVQTIKRWIEEGAKFDGPDPAAPLASIAGGTDYADPPATYSHPVPITAIAFSPDGKELAASGYHEITVWNASDGKLLSRIKGLPERIWGLAYSPDGKRIAVAAGEPGVSGELRLCNRDASVAGKRLERISDMMLAVRFSPDGKHIAAGGADNAAEIFDADSGKRELLIQQHADWVTDVAFSPDGTKIVTASRDRSARVFDSRTGEMLAAYLNHEEPIFGVAWSDDGKEIYSVGRDPDMHIWNAVDATPAGEGKGKSKAAGRVFLCNADTFKVVTAGGEIFICSADGVVRAFKQEKNPTARNFPAVSDWVYCLAVDSKTHHVAAGCHDGEIRIYDGENGELIRHFIAAP
jgi:WD40 repeat protein